MPTPNGGFALQFISHKLLRYLAFTPLAVLAFTSIVLLNDGFLYFLAAAGQIAFYVLAWQGNRQAASESETPAWCAIPYYFTLLNLACAQAAITYWRGERKVTWTPRGG